MTREIRGWHVFAVFAAAFGVIIAVNAALAVNAVRSFPGLEVANSYVASQRFDAERAAQEALGWDVRATLEGDRLRLSVLQDGRAITPRIVSAVFGRATSVARDQRPVFTVERGALVAPVEAGPGNWNLRLTARAEDGTLFRQRVVVRVAR